MSVPVKKAKINSYEYRINETNSKMAEEAGATCLTNKEIAIHHHLSEDLKRDTVLHECLHALLEDIVHTIKFIDDDEKAEEALVRLLTPRLMDFGRKNHKLVKWIFDYDNQ